MLVIMVEYKTRRKITSIIMQHTGPKPVELGVDLIKQYANSTQPNINETGLQINCRLPKPEEQLDCVNSPRNTCRFLALFCFTTFLRVPSSFLLMDLALMDSGNDLQPLHSRTETVVQEVTPLPEVLEDALNT